MSFLFPTLLWIGLPLVAIPVLIHLLHRGRQERVPWAAMQFLIESQKKYQRWVNLKQLLLLLSRMALIGVVALLVAQPLLRANWAALLSPRPVHHVVLLDDSFSMTDRDTEGTAWSRALAVLDKLVTTTAANSTSAQLTVIRFSDALRAHPDDAVPFTSTVTAENLEQLQAQIASWRPSETDAPILRGLEVGSAYSKRQPPQQEIVVHVCSDFRRHDWQDSSAIVRELETISDISRDVELVQCVQQLHENLAIVELAIEAGVEAADVEVWFQIAVRNCGNQRAEQVAVDITQDGRPQTAVSLGDIAPGETVAKRFRTTFGGAGEHWLAAQLEPDAVQLDNIRYYAANLPERQKILLIDGTFEGEEGSFLATALAPGGRARTGWEVISETPTGLARYDDLSQFAAIALLSVPRLANEALDKLEDYVRAGGGVWITVDDSIDREFYNDNLYRDGSGLLALPLKFPAELEPSSTEAESDLVASSHSAMRIFSGSRNDYLKLASVRMFYETRGEHGATPAEVRLLATLRNGAPWMAEKQIGRGVAITQFARLSPLPTRVGSWSNLAVNPAFPVLANEIAAYLARQCTSRPLYRVGEELAFGGEAVRGVSLSRLAALPNETLDANSTPIDAGGQLWQSGLFRVAGQDNATWPALIAVNVAVQEGTLPFLSREEIDSRLGDLSSKINVWLAEELTTRPATAYTGRIGDALLVTLLGLLVSEQALAYWSSYHRRRTSAGESA